MAFFVFNANAQDFVWAKHLTNNYNYSNSVERDNNGNLIIVGYFENVIDFDPSSSGTANLGTVGGYGTYIAKYDANGNYLWAKMIDEYDEDVKFDLDNNGDIILSGDFYGTYDFNPGAGINSLTSSGLNDVFILKVNSNGDFQWVKQIGSADYDVLRAFHVDNSGNIYLSTEHHDDTDLNPDAGSFQTGTINTGSSTNTALIKLNNTGNFIWALVNSNLLYITDIKTDSNNNVIIGGDYNQSVDFNFSTTADSILTAYTNSNEMFIAKYNSSGAFLWVKSVKHTSPSAQYNSIEKLSIDHLNNVYAIANFRDTINFDIGISNFTLTNTPNNDQLTDIAIMKYTDGGQFVFAKQMGNANNDYASNIFVNTTGVYITAKVNALPMGARHFKKNAIASTDITGLTDIIAKYSLTGNIEWIYSIEPSAGFNFSGLQVSQNGEIYTSGRFSTECDFNPSGTNGILTGGTNTFLLKINECLINNGVTLSGNTFTANQSGATYQWIDCNNSNSPINGATSQAFTPTVSGTYAVQINNATCSATSSCLSVSITAVSIKEYTNNIIEIYPNPAKNFVTIDGLINNSNIQIIDALGKIVFSESNNSSKVTINTEMFNSGIYFVKIESIGNSAIKKLVLNK